MGLLLKPKQLKRPSAPRPVNKTRNLFDPARGAANLDGNAPGGGAPRPTAPKLKGEIWAAPNRGRTNLGSQNRARSIYDPNQDKFSSEMKWYGSMKEQARSLNIDYEAYQEKWNPSLPFNPSDYDQERFRDLAKSIKTKDGKLISTKVSINDSISAFQLESEGEYKNLRHPDPATGVNLDFETDGPGNYTHLDFKHPVGSEVLAAADKSFTIQQIAESMGEKAVKQKKKILWVRRRSEKS
jgi:hypothetical protein